MWPLIAQSSKHVAFNSTVAPHAALRSSSAAGDPAADTLAVVLDPRSLLTLLQAVLSPPTAASVAASPARVRCMDICACQSWWL